MKTRVFLTAATMCAVTLAAAAQSRPDFSGTWEMDVERTRAENSARSATAGGGATMGGGGNMMVSGGGGGGATPAVTAVRITQTTAALTVDRVSGQVWEKMIHTLDGSESVNVNGQSTMKVKSRWDGARLVSEGTSETALSDGSGSFTGTIKEVRWLDKDGTMVVESTRVVNPPPGVQVSNAGVPRVTVQYFKKKYTERHLS